jgi:hypothetical protein
MKSGSAVVNGGRPDSRPARKRFPDELEQISPADRGSRPEIVALTAQARRASRNRISRIGIAKAARDQTTA